MASLRGYSWDPQALFRHHAKPYLKYYSPKPIKPRKTSYSTNVKRSQTSTQARVEQAIQHLTTHQIDITNNEPDWFRIACAFANEFGEQGRGYFHTVSQFHSEYDPRKTDRKYDHILRGQFRQIGIGKFLGMVGNIVG